MTTPGQLLQRPLTELGSPAQAKKLQQELGLSTVGDLLTHYPRRYVERGRATDLGALIEGDQVTVMAQVQRTHVKPLRQRRGSLLEVVVGDGQHKLSLVFFNQRWRERDLAVGRWGLFAGKVSRFGRTRQLSNPDYQLLGEQD